MIITISLVSFPWSLPGTLASAGSPLIRANP